MKMFPIPVLIVGSNKRLFIPLIYLAGTASFCYIFLIAVVKVNPNHFHKREIVSETQPQSISNLKNQGHFAFNKNSNRLELKRKRTFEKFKREVDTDLFFDAYSDQRRKSESTTFISTTKRKTVEHFLNTIKPETLTNNQKNGARRSNSTKIWSRHQNLDLDLEAPSVQPWPQDQQCSGFKINFAYKGTFKPRALVSFPGSGNSWLRHLIECSTGLFTGSVFQDGKIYSKGLLGELRSPNDGSTIVQKTHHDALRFSTLKSKQAYVKLSELMFGYRGILLIRNPYDALISYWNFAETRDHRGHASKLKFNPFKWKNFVLTLIPKWTSMIMAWVEGSQDLLIVQYEKVKKNPHHEISRILSYLNQPLDEDRVSCLLKSDHVEGPFHRRHKNIMNSNKNSFPTNNPFAMKMGQSEMIEKEKNFEDLAQAVPEQNSKSWRNGLHHLEQNSSHLLSFSASSSLDLIVQDNIQQINRFFSDKYIPIFLNYRGPTTLSSL